MDRGGKTPLCSQSDQRTHRADVARSPGEELIVESMTAVTLMLPFGMLAVISWRLEQRSPETAPNSRGRFLHPRSAVYSRKIRPGGTGIQ